MSRHLSLDTLRALLDHSPGPGVLAGAHLLACPKCRARFQALSPESAGAMLESLDDLTPIAESLERFAPELLRETEEEFRTGASRARCLAALPSHQRWQVIRAEDTPPVPLLAGILSVLPDLIHDRPEDVLDLCRLGLAVAEPEGFEIASRSRASLMAELEANLANALRVLGQLQTAEKHMDRSLRLADESPDDRVRGQVFFFASVLARDSRRFEAAFALAEKSRRKFSRIGARPEETSLDLLEALISFFQADFSTAIPKLERLACNDTLDQAHRLSATFFLVKSLVLTGGAFKTGGLLPQLNQLARSFPSRHLDIQLSWLKGLILGSLGDPAAGEALMARAREYYLEKEILYDAALVTLDMAMVRFEAGHYDQAAEHAGGIVEAFAASGIHREALVALRYFQEAVRAKEETRERYQELQVFLPLSRRDPAYAYQPGRIG